MTGALASGKIKKYQSIMGGLLIMNFPFSYMFLQLGYSPEITLYISISLSLAALFIRLKILRRLIFLEIDEFLKKVVFKAIFIALISIVTPLILKLSLGESKLKVLIIVLSAMASVSLTVFNLGLTRSEKKFLINLVSKNGLINSLKIGSGD